MAHALGVNRRILLLTEFAYDFSAFCTSVIAYDKEGKLYHARNLDFIFSDYMRNITYEAHFIRNERVHFKAIMFAGLNGVFTG